MVSYGRLSLTLCAENDQSLGENNPSKATQIRDKLNIGEHINYIYNMLCNSINNFTGIAKTKGNMSQI